MEYHSNRKDVAFRFDVFALVELNDLRSDISWGSASKKEIFLGVYWGC